MNSRSNPCEYNPVTRGPSCIPPLPGDCKNDATLMIGAKGEWHICASCAALPEFKKYRVRRALKATASREAPLT
jgi:hypothetical protein